MQSNLSDVDVTLFPSADDLTSGLVPFSSGSTSGAAGLYHHDPTAKPHISINEKQLRDPMALIAALACCWNWPHHTSPSRTRRSRRYGHGASERSVNCLPWPCIFTANAAFRFKQYTNNGSQGWSARRLGYLSEELFGYALVRFALERGEVKPAWRKFCLQMSLRPEPRRSAA